MGIFRVSRLRAPVIAPGTREAVPRLRGIAGGAAPSGPRVWAFASGCGGLGRSTLSITLGARLVRRGRTTCVIDADWTSPTLGALLDLPGGATDWPGRAGELAPLPSGVHEDLTVVLGAAPMIGDPTRRDARQLATHVSALGQDDVLLDLPAGTNDAALDLWLRAERPILVAVPERLPLESTARLLGRVFARLARPWLARRIGSSEADEALTQAWDECAGRTGTWMRTVARIADVPASELASHVGRKPLYLVLNRVRRGDDVDVGHALVTAAGHGLGLDLRFRAALPWDADAWIRARRRTGAVSVRAGDLLGVELDEFLQRMDDSHDLPGRGNWRLDLGALAQLAGAGGSTAPERNEPPWR